MSLLNIIYYKSSNGQALKFAQEMLDLGIVKQIRQEKGVLQYEYFYPLNDPETIVLIDRFNNQEALDAHHKSQMMQEIVKLRNKYQLHMEVKQYQIVD